MILSINFKTEDYCHFKGECKRDLASQNFLCYICKYANLIDIPKMLDDDYNQQIEDTNRNIIGEY